MKSENVKINQHYVPRFYMKPWCGANQELRYLNLQTMRQGYVGPKKCCSAPCLYEYGKIGEYYALSNDIENRYHALEDQVSALFKRAFKEWQFSLTNDVSIFDTNDKQLLKHFVISMLLRNPLFDSTDMEQEICNNELRGFQELLTTMFQGQCDENLLSNIVHQVIRRDDWMNESNILGGMLYKDMFSMIESLDLCVLRSQKRFVFSDNPVIYTSSIITGNTFFYLPMSPSYALLFGQSIPHSRSCGDVNNRVADMFNKMYKENSRYVYFCESSIFDIYSCK